MNSRKRVLGAFNRRGYDRIRPPGTPDIKLFRATEVDTDPWARRAKEAEMGYILNETKYQAIELLAVPGIGFRRGYPEVMIPRTTWTIPVPSKKYPEKPLGSENPILISYIGERFLENSKNSP